jgi:ketosteroid isomerase-like protein
MSEENVEVARRNAEAWARGDLEGAIAPVAEDVEWDISAHPLPDWPDTGRGLEDLRGHLVNYVRGWREYRAEAGELIDAGEEVVVIIHETVGLRDSDAELDRDLHFVWTVRNGRLQRLRVFPTREACLRAAGLDS